MKNAINCSFDSVTRFRNMHNDSVKKHRQFVLAYVLARQINQVLSPTLIGWAFCFMASVCPMCAQFSPICPRILTVSNGSLRGPILQKLLQIHRYWRSRTFPSRRIISPTQHRKTTLPPLEVDGAQRVGACRHIHSVGQSPFGAGQYDFSVHR